MTTSTLRILLLGAPAMYVDDQPLQIQRRLLRWMLFYLACQKEMVGRSDLILLFWPDEPEEDARRHLREMLSKLRAQLPDPGWLLTEQDRVGLDPQYTYSDVLEFEALSAQTLRACAQTPASTPLAQAVYQKVVQAVHLWRSARFMAGARLPESEGLNDWLLNTSQQLEVQRQRLLERLADHDTASGDAESALQRLRSALEGDETNESLHFRMLSLMHKQGRYSEALNHCSYLQELYEREGYSQLPPGLLSISRKIREGAMQPEEEKGQPSWPSLADLQVPFTGRQALLKEMQLAVRRGGQMILFGEAGSGKSRLVRELFFSLKPVPRLLLAPARVMENDLPFQPIIDLLRHDIAAEEWRQLDLAWVASLSLLLPELLVLRPEIQPLPIRQLPQMQLPASEENSLIFEALRQLLLFIGKKQRFLLFLDNAQWSDSASLTALAYLAERGSFGDYGALVLAARPEGSSNLHHFLNRPPGSFPIQRINLPPLETEEIATLAHYILGDAFHPAMLQRLERETGGNPLFLLETLRLVLEYSLDSRFNPAIERLPLAASILAIIRERIQQLSSSDAQVISMAAILAEGAGKQGPGEFTVDLLEKTCMQPPEQVVESLESLARMNLIQAALKDQPSGGYIFVQEKFPEVILLDMSAARKRLLHLRTARAIDQQHEGQSAEMETALARHYEQAGELNAAFQHWLKTALYAQNQDGKEKAIQALQHAEEILDRLGQQASDISIYQLYRQWGRLAYDYAQPQIMDEIFSRLLTYGQNRQNPLLVGSAYSGLAQAAELRIRPDQGLFYLEKALQQLEQVGKPFERIEALNRQGSFMTQMGRFSEAQKPFQKALSIGERATDSQSIEARSMTENRLSVLLMISGWPLLALEMADRSYKDAESTYNRAGLVRALNMKSVVESYLGRYQEGIETARQGLNIADVIQSPLLAGDLHGSMALSCFGLGKLDLCLEHAYQALQIAEQNRFSYVLEGMCTLVGKVFLFLGENEKAGQFFQRGSEAGLQNFHALENTIQLALVQAMQGDFQAALKLVGQADQQTLREEMILQHLSAQLAKVNIWIETGQLDEAWPVVEMIQREAEHRRLPEICIRALLLHARLYWCLGRFDQATNFARQAINEAAVIQHLPLEVESCLLFLETSPEASSEDQQKMAARLKNRLKILSDQSQSPEIAESFQKRYQAWTK